MGRDIFELVKADLDARNALGHVQYGGPLTSDSRRDWKIQKYQELLDLCVYFRAEIEEETPYELPGVSRG